MNVWVGWWTESSTEKAALPEVSSASASTSVRALTLSRPDRGSSSSSVPPPWARRTRSSTATETRRRCPPDSPRICASPMREVALSDSRTVEGVRHRRRAIVAREPRRAEPGVEVEVLFDRRRTGQHIVLGHVADGPLALARGGRRAAQQHGALDAAGAPAAGEDGEKRRLAGARRPDQARDPAAGERSARLQDLLAARRRVLEPTPRARHRRHRPAPRQGPRRQLRRRQQARRRPRERCELRGGTAMTKPVAPPSSTPTVWA